MLAARASPPADEILGLGERKGARKGEGDSQEAVALGSIKREEAEGKKSAVLPSRLVHKRTARRHPCGRIFVKQNPRIVRG